MSRLASSPIVVVGIIAAGAVLGLLVAAGSLVSPSVPAVLGPAWCAVAVASGLVVFRGVVAAVLSSLGTLTGLWGIGAVALTWAGPASGILGITAMLAVIAGGSLALVGVRRWRPFGRRYARAGKAPTPGVPPSSITLWDALDRGEDPTRGSGSGLM
jgi:hypothetical protein